MVDTGNIQTLLQISSLCVTMGKGVSYLVAHPESTQLHSDLQACLQILEDAVSENVPAALTQMGQLLASPHIEDPAQLSECFHQLLSEVSLRVTLALTKALEDIPQLERPVAEDLFAYFQQLPHTNAAVHQLMLDTFKKCGFSAPMESFQGYMQLFEEQPKLLFGPSAPHPDYIYRPSEQRTFEACPICGGTGVPYYCSLSYLISDFSYPFLPAKLWMKCESCGNLYSWKFPEEFLSLSNHSKLIFPNKGSDLMPHEVAGALLSAWSNILNKLQTYANGGGSLLEVGIGHGELLSVALEMGYDVDAVEIDPASAQKAADLLGIPIWNGDFLKYNTDKTYSIITMGDVIEHVTDPGLALRQAYQLLDHNGVLWLSTPNFESSFSKFYKFSDPMWYEPYHITYFSRRGFERLANQCGFVIREYHVSNRYNGSMELILTKQCKL